jgi:hypothetical protein
MSHGSASISSWLLRVVLVVAAFGVVGSDTIASAAAGFGVIDDANAAARAGRTELTNGGNYASDNQAVRDYAIAHGEVVVANSTIIGADGTVAVTLVRHAQTVFFGRIPFLRAVTIATATGTASPGP